MPKTDAAAPSGDAPLDTTGTAAVSDKAPEQTKAAEPGKAAEKPVAPMRLRAPYGFYEEDGTLRQWAAGQPVTDPDEIALLTKRKVDLEPAE